MNETNRTEEPSKAQPPVQPKPSRPWYARASTWLAGAVAGPVIVAIIVAVVLKFTGLDSSGQQPANSSSSSATVGPNVLKYLVSTVGLHDDHTIVFSKPYALSAWQRAHSDSLEKLGNNMAMLDQSFLASGGAYRRAMVIAVTITNVSDKTAEIVDANIVDRRLTKPWNGTLIYLPPQGNVSPSRMIFNLDHIVPVAENLGPYDRRIGGSFFSNHVIRLPPEEPTTIRIIVTAMRYTVSFRIAFKYTISGDNRTLTVGQGPKPFILSATDCAGSEPFPYQRTYSVFYAKGYLQPMNPEQLQAAQEADKSTLCAPIQ